MNLVVAAAAGVLIPLALQRAGRDPAHGSSVLLTFITDAMGFFLFLVLATVFLLQHPGILCVSTPIPTSVSLRNCRGFVVDNEQGASDDRSPSAPRMASQMSQRFNVLFLCTGNSARSIPCRGRDEPSARRTREVPRLQRWEPSEGGRQPVCALELLRQQNLPTSGLEVRAGTSSPNRARLSWTLSSLFVMTRRAKCARYGPASP